MRNSVTYPILKYMLRYTNDQQLHHYCHLMAFGVQVCLLILCHEYAQYCYEVYVYVTHWSSSSLKCTQMTLDICMLKNILLLHTQI